ncbi:MAG TPA: SDR family oxidoreductase [Caulobacteraceae bacterium]
MRVFVTGATGFIGSAVVQNLMRDGHQVVGLARSDASAAALAALGVEAHRGDITDPDSLVAVARASDGVIHTAFVHDFSNFAANVEIDRLVLEALVGALRGSGKPLVIASGTLMVSHARPATEKDAPLSNDMPRAASEAMVLAPENGLRGSVVRLAPAVHDLTRAGLVSMLVDQARAKGVSPYVGEGRNLWPAVHRLDAARLFNLALERAEPGTRLHAAAEELSSRAIAEAIGEALGVPVRSIAPEDAPAHFETIAAFVGLDNPTSSALTRQTFGWRPEGNDLLADIRESRGFQ